MRLIFLRPKVLIDLVAGMVGLAFDQLDGAQPWEQMAMEGTGSETDDLTQINGIGPAFARRLNDAGITSFGQLAGMSVAEVRAQAQLEEWQGDPGDWILQAGRLATA